MTYVNGNEFANILNRCRSRKHRIGKFKEETTFKELELRSCQSKIARNFKEQKKGRYTNE